MAAEDEEGRGQDADGRVRETQWLETPRRAPRGRQRQRTTASLDKDVVEDNPNQDDKGHGAEIFPGQSPQGSAPASETLSTSA